MKKSNFIFLLIIGLILCLAISAVSAEDNITLTTHDFVKYYQNDSQFECQLESPTANVSDKAVSFTIKNHSYLRNTDNNGIAKLEIYLSPGNYIITTTYQNFSVNNTITVLPFLISSNLTKYCFNDSNYAVKLVSKDGKPLGGKKVTLNINGKIYIKTTDGGGIAKLGIYLRPGDYVITAYYNDLAVSNNISVLPIIQSNDLTKYCLNDSHYDVKVLNGCGGDLAGASVTFNINGKIYNRVTNESGVAELGIYLRPGDYVITAYYNGLAVSNNISVLPIIQSNDLTKYLCNDSHYDVKVLNGCGGDLAGASVTFNINGKIYNRVTNESGVAELGIYLRPGDYVITAYYNDLAVSNNIKVLSRFIDVTGDIQSTYGAPKQFKVKLLNKTGSLMKNENITFEVNEILYTNYTDNNGIATLNLNLSAGGYLITYSADGVDGANVYNVRNNITLTTFNWDDGGDVTNNKIINRYLPNSDLIRKIVNSARFGTTMVTIKGGEGKSAFITSGTHGNELPSQLAVLRLINSFETAPINGTLYIIPFVCPKTAELNIRRYNGNDLNRIANVEGSVSYNIVQLISQLKCDAYGDFHSTQSPGIPGKDVIMGTSSPIPESANMAIEISKMSGFAVDNQLLTSEVYYGGLSVQTNLHGIPSIIAEVISVPGGIDKGSDVKSSIQVNAFLRYLSII